MGAATYGEDRAALIKLPFSLYVDGEDFLRISVLGIGTQVVRVSGRLMTPEGGHSTFSFDLASPASRLAAATRIASIGCGWIENVTAIAVTAGTGLAQTYVTVDLVRGEQGIGGVQGTLIAGYVSSLVRLAYPGSPIRSPLEGPGVIRSITGTDPGAGVEISETVPTGARWLFRAMRATLVTDGTVANRTPNLLFDDGAASYAAAGVNFNQTASTTFQYSFGDVGQTFVQTSVNAQVGTPSNIVLLGGHRLRTSTGAIVAGDNWGAPQYEVEEWLEGA